MPPQQRPLIRVANRMVPGPPVVNPNLRSLLDPNADITIAPETLQANVSALQPAVAQEPDVPRPKILDLVSQLFSDAKEQEQQILGYKPDGTPIYGPPLSAPQTRMTVGEPFEANLESLGGPAQPRYKDPLDADRRDQFNAEVPMESSFSSLDFFKSLLGLPRQGRPVGQGRVKGEGGL
jgi:hypothetical protein